MRTSLFSTLLAALLLCGSLLHAGDETLFSSEEVQAAATITEREALAHVRFLASDELLGRHSADPSIFVAARYLATRFEAMGIQPVRGSYFQDFDLARIQPSADNGLRVRSSAGVLSVASDGVSMAPLPFSGSGRAEGDIVFVGYGITAPKRNYDDYAGVDVEGKIVLMLRYEPGEQDPDSPWNGARHTRHSFFRTKVQNAMKHGARAVLLVTGPRYHDRNNFVGSGPSVRGLYEDRKDASSKAIPAFHVSQEVASTLLEATGRDLLALQDGIDTANQPASFSTGLEGTVTAGYDVQPVKTRNVVGLLPGTDRADEVVIVGAHYDHVGDFGDGPDTIHNGADDNASGTAAVLEIAQAFTSLSTRPRRTILFIAFGGEELGLLGSRYYVRHPLLPLDRTVAMYNLDMVGRNPDEPLMVSGMSQSPVLAKAIRRANGFVGTEVGQNPELGGGSDHMPFAREGIPAVHFFSGFHDDYHQVTDHTDKIAPGKIVDAARLTFLAALDTANREESRKDEIERPRRSF